MSDVPPGAPSPFHAALEARFAMRANRKRDDISPERWAYRKAAAVLTSFRLPLLKPVPVDTRGGEPADPMVLMPDTLPAAGGLDRGLVTLLASVRREALSRLGSREAMIAALAINRPPAPDDFQRFFEQWLRGTQPPIDQQNYRQIIWSADIVTWLRGVIPNLPEDREVQEALARRSIFGMFEHLADEAFVGRTEELAQLREFVGVLPPATLKAGLSRQVSMWLGLQPRAPLVIEGQGGIGKSALVGRFLVEHAAAVPELRYPFAYLAFDNPALRVTEPFTIISEIVAQLERANPGNLAAFEDFRNRSEAYAARRERLAGQTTAPRTRGGRLAALGEADRTLFQAFAKLIHQLSTRTLSNGASTELPFVLVLDTFEEVQYRERESLIGLGRLLTAVFRELPKARVIISGRSPIFDFEINGVKPTRLVLGELDQASRQQLLQRLGVSDARTAADVAHQVGGNPLNLRLAARLLESEQPSAGRIAGLRTTTWGWFSVSQELIRGQLYARILEHIHDEDVRKLAHPGLVVRRVTPEVIFNVLARPCDVNVPDLPRAHALFVGLAREHTLVSTDPDGALRYRPEIRTPALALLAADRPEQVRQIHEGAIRFYASRRSAADRAEELYHRLALDEEPSQLDRVWQPELGSLLAVSIEELPARARTWLASRIGLELPPDVRARADLEAWERLVGRKAIEGLRYLGSASVLSLLSERSERTSTSPLFAIEAKAHIQQHAFAAAHAVLERGINSLTQASNRGRLVELLWLFAHVCELEERIENADTTLERAAQVATSIRDRLCLLQILVQRLVLRHEHEKTALSDAVPIRDQAAAIVAGMPVGQLDRETALVRAAAAMIGPAYREAFVKAVQAAGIPEPPDRERLAAAQAIEKAIAAAPVAAVEDVARARATVKDLGAGRVASQVIPDLLLTGFYGAVASRAAAWLQRDVQSMSASNLPGLEEYREPWESEATPEAMS